MTSSVESDQLASSHCLQRQRISGFSRTRVNQHTLINLKRLYHWDVLNWLNSGDLDLIFKVTVLFWGKTAWIYCLLNWWISLGQTCIDSSLGQCEDLLRFLGPWPHFQVMPLNMLDMGVHPFPLKTKFIRWWDNNSCVFSRKIRYIFIRVVLFWNIATFVNLKVLSKFVGPDWFVH